MMPPRAAALLLLDLRLATVVAIADETCGDGSSNRGSCPSKQPEVMQEAELEVVGRPWFDFIQARQKIGVTSVDVDNNTFDADNTSQGCAQWCGTQTLPWPKKCNWAACSTCYKCDDIEVNSETCNMWCHTHTSPVPNKCTWHACSTCNMCTGGTGGGPFTPAPTQALAPAPTAVPAPTPAPQTEFLLVATTSCAENGFTTIWSESTCTAAAKALGLSDTTPKVSTAVPRPEGCYWWAGGKLILNTNPANIGTGVVCGGDCHPICAKALAPAPTAAPTTTPPLHTEYHLVTTGICAENGFTTIGSKSACTAAAEALGLSVTTPKVSTATPRPEGCYWWVGGNLILNTNTANFGIGVACGGDCHPICAKVLSSD